MSYSGFPQLEMLGSVTWNLLNKCWKSVSWLFCFKFTVVVRLSPHFGLSLHRALGHMVQLEPGGIIYMKCGCCYIKALNSETWNLHTHPVTPKACSVQSWMDGWMDKFHFSPLVSEHCCLLFVRTAGRAWSLPPSWPRCLGSDNCSHSVARCIADACRTRSFSPQQISA